MPHARAACGDGRGPRRGGVEGGAGRGGAGRGWDGEATVDPGRIVCRARYLTGPMVLTSEVSGCLTRLGAGLGWMLLEGTELLQLLEGMRSSIVNCAAESLWRDATRNCFDITMEINTGVVFFSGAL